MPKPAVPVSLCPCVPVSLCPSNSTHHALVLFKALTRCPTSLVAWPAPRHQPAAPLIRLLGLYQAPIKRGWASCDMTCPCPQQSWPARPAISVHPLNRSARQSPHRPTPTQRTPTPSMVHPCPLPNTHPTPSRRTTPPPLPSPARARPISGTCPHLFSAHQSPPPVALDRLLPSVHPPCHLCTPAPSPRAHLPGCDVAAGLHPRLGYQAAALQDEAVLDV